jgi:hypothetical protein
MVPEPPPSTSRLGDWYVHLVRFGRPEFAIATNERSLLTVLLPAQALRTTLAPNLRAAVGSLLESIGVSRETVAREIAAMEPVTFGRATNRRVLGSINDLAFQASVHLARADDLLTISRRLADTPMSAIGSDEDPPPAQCRPPGATFIQFIHVTQSRHPSMSCWNTLDPIRSPRQTWTPRSRPQLHRNAWEPDDFSV